MEELFLEAQVRAEIGKGRVKALRDQGFIPAVVYKDGKESLALKISHSSLLKMVHQHRIEGVVINLGIEGDKKQKSRPCLIKEIQYEPVHGDIRHVDFNEISLTESIKVNVPIVAAGEPAGVKQEGGSLEHILWEAQIECLPTQIPKEINVDVSGLKLGESIHIKDIVFPAGVKVLNDPAAIVLTVAAPMKEEAPAAEAIEGEAPQEPEVIKEKKEVPAEAEAEVVRLRSPQEGKEKEKEKK